MHIVDKLLSTDDEEMKMIRSISALAEALLNVDMINTSINILTYHEKTPLDLDALLDAGTFDFAREIAGINLNKEDFEPKFKKD